SSFSALIHTVPRCRLFPYTPLFRSLFQQRPSMGWGTVKQCMDPEYSARVFYEALKRVPGWRGMPVTVAAQAVQKSAYPNHYAKQDRKSTRLNSSHVKISYAVFCLKK